MKSTLTDVHEMQGNNEDEADPSKEIEDEFKKILLKEEDEAEKILFASEEEHDNEGGIDKVDVLTDIYQTEESYDNVDCLEETSLKDKTESEKLFQSKKEDKAKVDQNDFGDGPNLIIEFHEIEGIDEDISDVLSVIEFKDEDSVKKGEVEEGKSNEECENVGEDGVDVLSDVHQTHDEADDVDDFEVENVTAIEGKQLKGLK